MNGVLQAITHHFHGHHAKESQGSCTFISRVRRAGEFADQLLPTAGWVYWGRMRGGTLISWLRRLLKSSKPLVILMTAVARNVKRFAEVVSTTQEIIVQAWSRAHALALWQIAIHLSASVDGIAARYPPGLQCPKKGQKKDPLLHLQ